MPAVGFNMFSILLDRFIFPLLLFLGNILLYTFVVFLALLVYCVMKYQVLSLLKGRTIYQKMGNLKRLQQIPIKLKLFDFIRWKIVDKVYARRNIGKFREFGLTLFCGRQGSGKTISMIWYANMIRFLYPDCLIVTNFEYKYADFRMKSWRDFMEIKNGEKGVLFLIDEIHSEYSSKAWKDFPEELLSEVSQQRKERVKICASSQVFTRVVKALREQAKTVTQCSTFGGRWTFNKEYDALDYSAWINAGANPKKKPKTLRRRSFIQSNLLRKCYDTYEKIKRLEKTEFMDRSEKTTAAASGF